MKNWLKWILGGISVVLVGGLGSGVWEWIIKPATLLLSDAALTVTTLGMNQFRDELYVQVAISSPDRASVQVLNLLLVFMAGFSVSMPILAFLLRSLRKSYKPDASPPRIIMAVRKFEAVFLWGLIMVGVLTVSVAGLMYQNSYVSRAVGYLAQLQRIDAPFITPEERIQFASQSAQITTRSDYQKIVDTLVRIGETNHAKLPKFNIF